MAQASFEPETSRCRVLRSAVAPHWLGEMADGPRANNESPGRDRVAAVGRAAERLTETETLRVTILSGNGNTSPLTAA